MRIIFSWLYFLLVQDARISYCISTVICFWHVAVFDDVLLQFFSWRCDNKVAVFAGLMADANLFVFDELLQILLIELLHFKVVVVLHKTNGITGMHTREMTFVKAIVI